jgi:hypothetical protein
MTKIRVRRKRISQGKIPSHSQDAHFDEQEHTAENAEVGGQRFEKNAQRAEDRKCRGDVGEKADDDDDPAVIERLSFRRLLEQR